MSVSIWLQATRPRTLAAAFAPVWIGTALALEAGQAHAGAALAALWGAIWIQIGTNFANDYFDFIKGADTEDRLGPTRATQAGLVTPNQMRNATILAFAATLPAVAYLTMRGGWPIALLGAVSVLSGVLYTGGPKPLAYIGLGDVFVLVFFGPVAVAGTTYVQTLEVSETAIIAGLGPGLIATALLAVNNLRDVHTDTVANKRTLAVRFGATFARWEYTLCVLVPTVLLPLVLAWTERRWWLGATAITGVLAARLAHRAWTQDGRDLIAVLGATGKLLVVHSVIFGGLWWAA